MEVQNAYVKRQNYNANGKSTNLQQRSYQFSLTIIRFSHSFPEKRIYWIISSQLLRAATSIGANITEAKSSSSKREFIKYYEIALKSANETVYWLSLLGDSFPEQKIACEPLLKEASELCNMLGASILTLKGKNKF